jgi:Fe2+ transport system protein B
VGTTPQSAEISSIGTEIGTAVSIAVPIPGLGEAIAGLAKVAAAIFHGADPRQVPAAHIEQVYEVAADKLQHCFLDGMISAAQAVAGMQMFLQAAGQMYAQYASQLGTNIVAKSISHITTVISATISQTQTAAEPKITKEIDPTILDQYYPQPNTAGWYPDSIETGTQVAAQYLSTLPKNFVTSSVKQVASQLSAGNLAGAVQTVVSDVGQGGLGGIIILFVILLVGGLLLKAIFRA